MALFTAAILLILLGAIHSALGEIRIFRLERSFQIARRTGLPVRQVRILRATWQLATVFGWAFAGVLLFAASSAAGSADLGFVRYAIGAAVLAGSAVVLIGTRGRHPGWFVLLAVGVLCWLG